MTSTGTGWIQESVERELREIDQEHPGFYGRSAEDWPSWYAYLTAVDSVCLPSEFDTAAIRDDLRDLCRRHSEQEGITSSTPDIDAVAATYITRLDAELARVVEEDPANDFTVSRAHGKLRLGRVALDPDAPSWELGYGRAKWDRLLAREDLSLDRLHQVAYAVDAREIIRDQAHLADSAHREARSHSIVFGPSEAASVEAAAGVRLHTRQPETIVSGIGSDTSIMEEWGR